MPEARTLGLGLGALYVGLGTVELITHRDDSALALLPWDESLVGGGALVGVERWSSPARCWLSATARSGSACSRSVLCSA